MSTLKTSISIVALATGLAIGFAPQASLAQTAGAADAVQKMVDKTNDTTSKLDKLQQDEAKKQANMAKGNAKPPATQGTPGNGSTPGKSGGASGKGATNDRPLTGFSENPLPPSAPPSVWEEICNAWCKYWNKGKANNNDGQAAPKPAADKKAAEGQNQPKTTEAPKTETKKAEAPPVKTPDVKKPEPTPAKTPETKLPETPKRAVESRPVETPKTTSQSSVAPVVIPNRVAPALIPAVRVSPAVNAVKTPVVAPAVNVARTPVATPVAPAAVRPVNVPTNAAAVVSTTVGQVRIVTGPTVATPRVPTPNVPVTVRR